MTGLGRKRLDLVAGLARPSIPLRLARSESGRRVAAKPIERYVKKQIQDQGGWPRILERIASGETVADVSRTLLRPDGKHIDRSFLSRLLHDDPERSAQ